MIDILSEEKRCLYNLLKEKVEEHLLTEEHEIGVLLGTDVCLEIEVDVEKYPLLGV